MQLISHVSTKMGNPLPSKPQSAFLIWSVTFKRTPPHLSLDPCWIFKSSVMGLCSSLAEVGGYMQPLENIAWYL